MKSLKTQFETYLILKNFIQILKSFFLFSVSYSQPKIGILGCDTKRQGWTRSSNLQLQNDALLWKQLDKFY